MGETDFHRTFTGQRVSAYRAADKGQWEAVYDDVVGTIEAEGDA